MENGRGDNASVARKTHYVVKPRVGEIVFVWHDEMLYEARVDRVLIVPAENGLNRNPLYTVTIQTSKSIVLKNVGPEDIMQYDEISVRIAHELMRKHTDRPLALRPLPPPTVLGLDPQLDERSELQMKLPPSTGGNQAKFQFPPVLQMLILEDWEKITKEYHLISLPCVVTVRDILQKWAHRRKLADSDKGGEYCDLLLHYFDVALPKMLLYRFEVPQYVESYDNANEKRIPTPSYHYGGFHLLRFLVKLPFVLNGLKAPESHVADISSAVNDLANYLVRNGRIIFSQMHQPASKSYINKVALFTSGLEP